VRDLEKMLCRASLFSNTENTETVRYRTEVVSAKSMLNRVVETVRGPCFERAKNETESYDEKNTGISRPQL